MKIQNMIKKITIAVLSAAMMLAPLISKRHQQMWSIQAKLDP
jgi:hypothetical protein